MISVINTALSGLSVATQKLNVSGSNIANKDSTQTDTDGTISDTPYVPQQFVQASQASSGVSAHTQPASPASVSTYNPNNAAANEDGLTQYPNVDPAQQLVQANMARYDAQGNLSVLKIQNNLMQSVLDIVS